MTLLFAVLVLLFVGGLTSLSLGRAPSASRTAAAAGAVASLLGLVFAALTLWRGEPVASRIPLPLPLGEMLFQVDSLSCIFLLPVFLVGGIGSLLLPGRMQNDDPDRAPCIHCGRHGFFFCAMLAGMILALTAADGVFFLLSWELMSLAPFFLLAPHEDNSRERFSCRVYLVAAHLGALPLLLLFSLLSAGAEGTSFAAYASATQIRNPGLLFLLALTGFGAKLGLFPLYVWMPKAYPVAPGHVAIVLSGAMVNVGFYGLLRIMGLLGAPQAWWAYVLMAAGGVSGLFGILFAMAQPDMKRTLAYSSSENMGIVCLSLGAGLLAGMNRAPEAMALLLGGAMLHMWNHSLFKSLLFAGVGAVEDGAGATRISRLGGLQRRMPVTGSCMALGCAAIAGLPPLNGFTGELLMYLGFAQGGMATRGTEHALCFWGGLFVLASIAGLALLCFTRMYGLSFLGIPRTPAAEHARGAQGDLRLAMGTLAALCVLSALAAPLLLQMFTPALRTLGARLYLPSLTDGHLALAGSTLRYVTAASLMLAGVLLLVVMALQRLRAKNTYSEGITWDCGYRLPSSRMQYSGGSFAWSAALVARYFLRARMKTPHLDKNGPLFPSAASAVSAEPALMDAPDWPLYLWGRLFAFAVQRLADRAKALQHGLVNSYVLYVLVALLAALVWALGWS